MQKFLEEFAPLIIFFVLNLYGAKWFNLPESQNIFIATAGFMLAFFIIIGWNVLQGKRPQNMTLITGGFILVFGGLTLVLQNEIFIKIKPSIIYILFASILAFGLWRGKNFLHMLMGKTLPLTETGWHIFTRRWVWFFLSLALLNEIIWRNFSTDFWVSFKLFGFPFISIAFIIVQVILLKPHIDDSKN